MVNIRWRIEAYARVAVFMVVPVEKRYGKADGLDDWESANWGDIDVSFIWGLNESETILLTHSNNQTSAEFQDLSVCQ